MIQPLYIQIANEIRNNINEGVYKIGDQLPTENQLAKYFQVNRHTLRKAIASLKREGLLRVNQGRGTFVAGTPLRYPLGKKLRYEDALLAQGRQPHYRLLRITEATADEQVAGKLNLEVGDRVALIERLDSADSQPISVVTSHFPLEPFPDLLQQCYRLKPLPALLKEVYGCEHLRQTTHISTTMVKLKDARLLHLSLNHPIFTMESVYVDQKGDPIEFSVARLRGDLVELVVENE